MFAFITKIIAIVMSLALSMGGLVGWQPPEPAPLAPLPEVEKMAIDSGYVIVAPANASAVEATAANTLQDYLRQISGITFPIVTDAAAPVETEFIVGVTNREGTVYTVDRAALGEEGVHIQTAGGTIVITGGSVRGVLYAVYTFLEEYLDCRWFSADVRVIPQANPLLVAKDIDYTFVPVLDFRETDWISPRDRTFSLANKLNAQAYRSLDASVGGGPRYAVWFAHSLQSMFPPAVFEANPEMRAFGKESGTLTVNHPCLSQESVYQYVLAQVRAAMAANPDAEIVSVTHPDNQDYCVCAACQTVYDEEGSPAGLMLRFVNRIADDIKGDYPNVKVDTFAYQYTRNTPAITKPRDNVIVRLCSIECCFAHPLDDPSCERNVAFVKDIHDWKDICNTLHIWDYTTNYANFNGPFNNWTVIQPNLKFFMANNVKGVYEEGNYMASQSNGEFADLRAYLLAKLMWDSEIDLHRAMVEFCEAYYGEAGKYIMKYLTLVTARTGKGWFGKTEHLGIWEFSGNDATMFLNMADIEYCDGLWASAKAADLTEEQLLRVRRSEISWRYWKSTKKMDEFNIFNCHIENEKLFNDMKELGISRISEGEVMAEKPFFYDTPSRWTPGRVPDWAPPGMFY